MKLKYPFLFLIILLQLVFLPYTWAQIQPAVGQENTTSATDNSPCISDAQYREMEAEMDKNRKLLNLPQASQKRSTQLAWPLQPSPKIKDCSYYYISAFVDQNTSTGAIQDWNCGSRTYDGHRGVDLVPWPFIWDKMDSNFVSVVAAAPGTIIAKVDGNPDRVCNGVGGGSNSNNYITIQHADGSTALYVHLKTGSFTAKTVGQTVSTGEYLGIVGSAGQSTGAHLHFEIRSDGTFAHYTDPFYGTCNQTSNASWWAVQKPYEDPALVKLSLHGSWPYMAVCPNTKDSVYEVDEFIISPGAQATFYACSRDVAANMGWNFKILDPNQTVIDNWDFTNNATPRRTSSLGWTKTLPTQAGVYAYQGTFNGITCSKTFTMKNATGLESRAGQARPGLYPNPAGDEVYFSETFHGIELYNLYGQLLQAEIREAGSLKLNQLSPGLYYLRCLEGNFLLKKE